MAALEVKVPDIGDFKDVEIIEVLVKAGDRVQAEQSLVTVESDKASMEIPSSAEGVVKELKVKVGDKVNEGSLLLLLDSDGPATPSGAPRSRRQRRRRLAAASPAPAAAPAPAGGEVDVVVPDIGDFDEVAVIEMLVKPGDTVAVEQSLITVESDKASMEIPSSAAGVVKALKVKVGDKVSKGSVIATLQGAPAPRRRRRPQRHQRPPYQRAPHQPRLPLLPPAAPNGRCRPRHCRRTSRPRRPARCRTPRRRSGSSRASSAFRSTRSRAAVRRAGSPRTTCRAFVKAVLAGQTQTKAQASKGAPGAAAAAGGGLAGLLPWPQVDFAKFGPIEKKDLSRIKKISGPALHRNWVTIPHVTNHDDADITDLEAFRVSTNKENEKSGVKVTMLAFLIKASVAALQKFPDFNASLEGDQLVLKKYFHIGFAADTPNGLVVPVIRDADKKGVLQISTEMGELAKKARDGKLTPTDMSGGCFSISSLGGIGGRYFTPIINAPEVAILGVCRSLTEPVWDGKAFQPRLMLPLSLSWDHRVVDGASAARFNAFLIQVLGDFRRVCCDGSTCTVPDIGDFRTSRSSRCWSSRATRSRSSRA